MASHKKTALYTCYNLNLEIFTETRANRQEQCLSILRY
jgi:hypothetical protein